ncbi:MAG: D-aminoacylase [Chloroflexi bacterium]|nr:D-aminoacylase [Chloroflexota bacterium]
MLDLLITGALVLDGTGKMAFAADVGVATGRIVRVAPSIEQEAARTIDGKGLHLAPGFIDPHTHSDFTLLIDPRAESKVYQGVTTEVIGNCGSSPAPLLGAGLEDARQSEENSGLVIDWTGMGEYIARLKQAGTALNVVPLVGHNTIRAAVLGFEDVQPTPAQQAEMERLTTEAMQEGARGISTGLYYPPGFYARTEEVIGLARAAGRFGGIYASHIRSESDGLFDAVEEALEIGRQAEVRVEISHVKLEGYRNFEGIERLEAMLAEAYLQGISIGCDQYPYTASSTWLGAILPYWAQVGGSKVVAGRLRDADTRRRLRQDWEQNRPAWEDRSGVADWSQIVVTEADSLPELLGKNIAEIASSGGKDGLDAALDLIAACQGQVGCVFFDQDEDNVRTLMRNPLVVVGSDGNSLSPHGVLGRSKPHPRSYGTFPRVLGRYVREEKIVSLEAAVQKMTSITAQRFGLTDRGIVREGMRADLVLFDAATVAERATFTDPHQFPAGIPYVIVNGILVVDGGEHTGRLPGMVL